MIDTVGLVCKIIYFLCFILVAQLCAVQIGLILGINHPRILFESNPFVKVLSHYWAVYYISQNWVRILRSRRFGHVVNIFLFLGRTSKNALMFIKHCTNQVFIFGKRYKRALFIVVYFSIRYIPMRGVTGFCNQLGLCPPYSIGPISQYSIRKFFQWYSRTTLCAELVVLGLFAFINIKLVWDFLEPEMRPRRARMYRGIREAHVALYDRD